MVLNEVYKYHSDWLTVAYSYLKNKEDAEDIIQDVYLKIHTKLQSGKINNIKYKDTINKYFVYKVIRNTCLDYLRKKKTYIDFEQINISIKDEINEDNECKSKMFIKIADFVNDWEKEEKEIFDLYMYSGMSMQSVSNLFNVSKSTIFNRIKDGKIKIKERFGEDMEDYFNNDFERI